MCVVGRRIPDIVKTAARCCSGGEVLVCFIQFTLDRIRSNVRHSFVQITFLPLPSWLPETKAWNMSPDILNMIYITINEIWTCYKVTSATKLLRDS